MWGAAGKILSISLPPKKIRMADADVHAALALQGWERAWRLDDYFAGWEGASPDDPLTFCAPPDDEIAESPTSFADACCQTPKEWNSCKPPEPASEGARHRAAPRERPLSTGATARRLENPMTLDVL